MVAYEKHHLVMKKPSAGLVAAAIILLAPFGFWIYYDIYKTPMLSPRLKEFYQVPFFKLANQLGDTVTSDDLKGYVYVTDFFFASCPGVCPKLSTHLSKMQENFKDEQRIKFVSITVDPMRDSVAALKAYSEKYKAVDTKWYFLTGVKDTIYNLAEKGFKVPVVEDVNGEEEFTHTDRMVLVDGTGMIRGYYNVVEDTAMVDSLYNDIERLLIEKPKS